MLRWVATNCCSVLTYAVRYASNRPEPHAFAPVVNVDEVTSSEESMKTPDTVESENNTNTTCDTQNEASNRPEPRAFAVNVPTQDEDNSSEEYMKTPDTVEGENITNTTCDTQNEASNRPEPRAFAVNVPTQDEDNSSQEECMKTPDTVESENITNTTCDTQNEASNRPEPHAFAPVVNVDEVTSSEESMKTPDTVEGENIANTTRDTQNEDSNRPEPRAFAVNVPTQDEDNSSQEECMKTPDTLEGENIANTTCDTQNEASNRPEPHAFAPVVNVDEVTSSEESMKTHDTVEGENIANTTCDTQNEASNRPEPRAFAVIVPSQDEVTSSQEECMKTPDTVESENISNTTCDADGEEKKHETFATKTEDSKRQSSMKKRCRDSRDPVAMKRRLTCRATPRVQFTSITVYSFPVDLGASSIPSMRTYDCCPVGLKLKHCNEETYDVPEVKEEDPPIPVPPPTTGENAPKRKQTRPRVRYIPPYERSVRLYDARVDQDEIEECNQDIRETYHFRNLEKRQFAKEEEERKTMMNEDKQYAVVPNALGMADQGNYSSNNLHDKRPAPNHHDDPAAKRRKLGAFDTTAKAVASI